MVAGCAESEGIRTYTVKRTESARAPVGASRTLGAIIPRGDEAWFFKLMGPDSATASQAASFEGLIKSLRFSTEASGEPQWTLPSGWTQQPEPGNAMRFATLTIDVEGEKLECTVSKLPFSQPLDEYLLANINRWRGQIRLPPLAVADLPQQTKTVKLTDGELQATVVNMLGESAPVLGSAPFAGTGGAPFADGRARSTARPASSNLVHQAPAGWTPGELEVSRGGIAVRREAVYEVKDGEQRVEITVTKLPAAAGATLPNVNRWRGQIGLDPISAEQLEQEKRQLQFGGTPADYVEFTGSEQGILGVIAERGGVAWFVKLQGHRELVEREQQHFEEFVRSIRFE
jgi:hypothetical protein